MLSEDEFSEWGAKDITLFLHVTSQVKTDKYDDLLGRKGGGGFPHFAVLDSNGDLLATLEGDRSVDGFGGLVKQGQEKKDELAGLKKKADAGDKDAAKKLFFEKLDLLHYTPETGRKAAADLGLNDEEKKKAEGAFVGMEVADVIAGLTQEKETHIAAGKKFAAMHKDGKAPGDPSSMNWVYFYYFIMVHAEEDKNADLFEEALEIFRKEHGNNSRYSGFLTKQEETLQKLKEDK